MPYAMRMKVKAELDRLQEQVIIEPVTFSDWAAPIVPVLKRDKSVRICGGLKMTVNHASRLDKYPIPKIEDLFTKLAGGTRFTNLDVSKDQQIRLDEESCKYVAINTLKGLFKDCLLGRPLPQKFFKE